MADRPERRAPRTTKLVVRRTEWTTPHLIRVVAAPADPADLARFADSPHTDGYIKVVFLQPDVAYPEPFDMATARTELPRHQWPTLRTYTLREVDRDTGEIVIDFVYHGDVGLAGPWAASAEPGTELLVVGPGGAYAPDPDAGWHLLVGDESALPAIAAALAEIPAGAPVHAFVEVADAAEEQKLSTAAELHLSWVHRESSGDGALVEAVRALEFPEGRVHAFVHGEASAVKELRRHLVDERALSTDQLSISGYWRRGFDDESHRALKAAERAQEQ
ncbi:MAG TPA: siderophore-interacting protein [Pseudonocardia sp.]|nr:siderophore-interacting protein [Pseudonocardia sp.]